MPDAPAPPRVRYADLIGTPPTAKETITTALVTPEVTAALVAAIDAGTSPVEAASALATDFLAALDAYLRAKIGPLPWVRATLPGRVTAVGARTCTVQVSGRAAAVPDVLGPAKPAVGDRVLVRFPVALPPAGAPLAPGPAPSGQPWIKGGAVGLAFLYQDHSWTQTARVPWPPVLPPGGDHATFSAPAPLLTPVQQLFENSQAVAQPGLLVGVVTAPAPAGRETLFCNNGNGVVDTCTVDVRYPRAWRTPAVARVEHDGAGPAGPFAPLPAAQPLASDPTSTRVLAVQWRYADMPFELQGPYPFPPQVPCRANQLVLGVVPSGSGGLVVRGSSPRATFPYVRVLVEVTGVTIQTTQVHEYVLRDVRAAAGWTLPDGQPLDCWLLASNHYPVPPAVTMTQRRDQTTQEGPEPEPEAAAYNAHLTEYEVAVSRGGGAPYLTRLTAGTTRGALLAWMHGAVGLRDGAAGPELVLYAAIDIPGPPLARPAGTHGVIARWIGTLSGNVVTFGGPTRLPLSSVLACSPDGAAVLGLKLAGGQQTMRYSEDSGATWHDCAPPPGLVVADLFLEQVKPSLRLVPAG